MKKTGFLLIIILLCFSCTKKQIEKTETGPYVEPLKMVYVEGGEFLMGNLDEYEKDQWTKNVIPHKVHVSSFKISTTEITQSLYKEIMQDEKWYDPEKLNCPVRDVSWYCAVEFCNRLSEQEGLEKCYIINGKNVDCNFKANGYKPNELGLYDMSGNAYEWCWDWWDYELYPKEQTKNPTGLSNKDGELFLKVIKGGNYFTSEIIYHRFFAAPETGLIGTYGSLAVGFRICQSVIE